MLSVFGTTKSENTMTSAGATLQQAADLIIALQVIEHRNAMLRAIRGEDKHEMLRHVQFLLRWHETGGPLPPGTHEDDLYELYRSLRQHRATPRSDT